MKKKLFLFTLTVFMIFVVPCIQAADELSAKINEKSGMVFISGAPGIEYFNQDVIILATESELDNINSENIVYIGSCRIDGYGRFRLNFPIECANPENLKIHVKSGIKNLTHTVISARYERIIDLDYEYDNADKQICLNFNNVFWDADNILVAAASYSNEGKLIGINKMDVDVGFIETNKCLFLPFDVGNADRIKVFVWENVNIISPISATVDTEVSAPKEIEGINVGYGSALSVYDSTEIKATADKLFAYLDPTSEDTKAVYTLYSKGYYLESLILFRNYMIERLRKIDYTDSISDRGLFKSVGGNSSRTDAMDVLCGKMTAEEYNSKYKTATNSASYFQKDYGGYFDTFNTNIDSSIRWLEIPSWITTAVSYPTDALSYSGSTTLPMICRYACTGDRAYLNRYIQLLNDYSCNYVDMVNSLVDGMNDEDGKYYQKYIDSRVWKYPLGGYNAAARLETAGTAQRIIAGLITMCKALPSENIENQYTDEFYMEMNDAIYTDKLSDEAYNLVDPVRFANICYQLSYNEFFRLSSYLDGVGIQNQALNGLTGLIKYLCIFKDFTCCNQYKNDIFTALDQFYEKSIQQDGGYLEISVGYNLNDYVINKTLEDWIGSICPEYMLQINLTKLNKYYEKITEAMTSPIDLMSNYGNAYFLGTEAYWKLPNKASELESKREYLQNNRYTSLYLPYSGYGSMRNDWSEDSMYVSFFNYNKRNTGHGMTGTNAVLNLTAFKRTLLLSGGTHFYGTVDELPATATNLKDKFYELNSYLEEVSTRKWSTVLVNDKSQADKIFEFNEDGSFSAEKNYGTALDRVDNTILNSRWLSDDKFDFTEGSWEGGYSLIDRAAAIRSVQYDPYTDTGAISKDAEHKRQMIFAKSANLLIVNDKLKNTLAASLGNSYSEVWNFPGYDANQQQTFTGFTNEQIITNAGDNLAYTNDTSGPNLFIKSFSPSVLTYKKYYGFYEAGKVGVGWFRGGSDTTMGSFAPKADVYVNWSDSGFNDVTQVISILAPSINTENPIKESIDLSDGDIAGFDITLNDGKKLLYLSAEEKQNLQIGEINANAISLLVVEENGKYNCITTDCDSLKYRNSDVAIADASFEFSIENNNVSIESAIEVPEKFEWNTADEYPEYK